MTYAAPFGLPWVEDDVVSFDASDLEPDLASVDVLARLQVSARRSGCELRLHGLSAELRCLVELAGLDDVLLGRRVSPLIACGQAEQREQLGVEEARDPGDTPP
jgi:hypothetical protein